MMTLLQWLKKYRKKGADAEQHYYKILQDVWALGLQGKQSVNQDEFVEGIKKFVTQSDVKQRIKAYADTMFEVD